MGQFARNPSDFAADCRQHDGQCPIVRDNFLFLDEGDELAAIDLLEWRCGYVVIVPDAARDDSALLYHTSCQRMTDVVGQVFEGRVEAPVSLPQRPSEMTLGEMHRRRVRLPYADCRVRIAGFDFRSPGG